MFITVDTQVNMGYIYLQQPKNNNPIWKEKCNIKQYIEGNTVELPYIVDDKEIQEGLRNLTLSEKTYLEDLEVKFEEEYLNDQENEYITGIELNLSKVELINFIKDKVFRLYDTQYLGRKFLFISLDYIDNIFDDNNIVYAANSSRDVFYIVAIEDETCYIKGILSSRYDLYNPEYLKVPNFILFEG